MHDIPNVAATALARHNLPLLRLRGAAIRRMVAAFAMCATSALPLNAAEVKLGNFSNVVIEGNIESGDYEILRTLIKDNDNIDSIYLAWPGGNVAEAIKIGRFVRGLRLETEIPGQFSSETRAALSADEANKTLNGVAARNGIRNREVNYMCASACFFVFVAGVHRIIDEIGFFDHEPALGVHRPFFADSELNSLSADAAIASAKQARSIIDNYINEMGVPTKYVELMFATPKDQIRWITGAEFGSDLEGVIPELKDWVDARCDKLTDVEKIMWSEIKDKLPKYMTATEKSVANLLGDKKVEQDECEEKALKELSREARLKMSTEQK